MLFLLSHTPEMKTFERSFVWKNCFNDIASSAGTQSIRFNGNNIEFYHRFTDRKEKIEN